MIHFTNYFWKYILYCYKEPTQNNIRVWYEIRVSFINYYNLVNKIFEKKGIRKEAQNYYENDEIAFLLDDIIKIFMEKNKSLKNIEKLNFITKYNPYYKEERFFEKIDSDIFNFFSLNEIDDLTNQDFRKFNFENIFKGKINDLNK